MSNISLLTSKLQRKDTHGLRQETMQDDPNFRQFCILVAENMPNLQTLLLWITVCVPDIERILTGQTGQGWVAAMKSIPVGRRFELSLKLNFDGMRHTRLYRNTIGSYTGPDLNDMEKVALMRKAEEGFKRLLMPNSLGKAIV
jgi:hypothetical protein